MEVLLFLVVLMYLMVRFGIIPVLVFGLFIVGYIVNHFGGGG